MEGIIIIKLMVFIVFIIFSVCIYHIMIKSFTKYYIEDAEKQERAFDDAINEMKEKGIKRIKYGKIEIELK